MDTATLLKVANMENSQQVTGYTGSGRYRPQWNTTQLIKDWRQLFTVLIWYILQEHCYVKNAK